MERLNKYLAHAGVGSRRHCDKLIAAGRVKVDGVKVTELGLKIDPAKHQVAVDDPAVVNSDPYGAGWLLRIDVTAAGPLLSADEYAELAPR